MKKEIIYSRLDEQVIEKKNLSAVQTTGSWQVVPYETAQFGGNMLYCGECADAPEITLELKVSGWYFIYLGMVSVTLPCRTGISLSKKDGIGLIDGPNTGAWASVEWIEDVFYRAADLSGKQITLFNPCGVVKYSSALAYIRLVQMSQSEVEEYTKKTSGVIAYNFDRDFLCDMRYENAQDYAERLKMLENSGGGLIFREVYPKNAQYEETSCLACTEKRNEKNERYIKYEKIKSKADRAIIDMAHSLGFGIYAARRMGMGDFVFPNNASAYNTGIQEQYSSFKVKTRFGKFVNALSFAYSEVRAATVREIMRTADGYDGITLIFQRGVLIGFEQPIEDEVSKKYGVSASRLPYGDKRLSSVLCSYFTAFMRELKNEVCEKYGEKMGINVLLYSDLKSSYSFGFDAERWAKEGLIDGISQGLMTLYEDLDGVISVDGLIDTEKYQRKNGQNGILKRRFDGWSCSTLADWAKEYAVICEKYGLDFYATLGWENETAEKIAELAHEYERVGIKKLISWNTGQKIRKLDTINAEKELSKKFGRTEFFAQEKRLIRVLSVCGNDISEYNVNWNG